MKVRKKQNRVLKVMGFVLIVNIVNEDKPMRYYLLSKQENFRERLIISQKKFNSLIL